MNKAQGNIGEAAAILHYTKKGCIVSKPLFENTPYDLVVDSGEGLKRVQVKTSRNLKPSGKYEVNLRVFGGNRSGTGKVKHISKDEVDILFALLGDDRIEEVDVADIDGRSTINL